MKFAPLPMHLFDENLRLAATMRERYTSYRNAVVVPTFRKLAEVRAVVILVDIFSLLVGGVDRYNDNRQVLLIMFEYLADQSGRSDNGVFAGILEMLGCGRRRCSGLRLSPRRPTSQGRATWTTVA